MTDPEMADVTYIEPITWKVVEKIIEKERPDASCCRPWAARRRSTARSTSPHGVLEKFGVEMIGASREAIDKAEDREKFKQAMTKIGLGSARSASPQRWKRPSRCRVPSASRRSSAVLHLGGSGGGIAYNQESSSRSASAVSKPRRPASC